MVRDGGFEKYKDRELKRSASERGRECKSDKPDRVIGVDREAETS